MNDLAWARSEFYRLTNTSSTDSALTEFDSATNENVDSLLTDGFYDAQNFLVGIGLWTKWVVVSSDLQPSAIQGSDTAILGRYVQVADYFLRLTAYKGRSALFQLTSGRRIPWGTLVDAEDGPDAMGDYYWIDSPRTESAAGSSVVYLRFARGASLPSANFYYEFVRVMSAPAVGTALDFPTDLVKLGVAQAAADFATHPAFPGDAEAEAKLERNLLRWKLTARKRARRTREPRHARAPRTVGSHFFLLR